MDAEDRAKLDQQLAEAVVEFESAARRADDGAAAVDLAPGVPYADLTPEQKAARMAATKPAGWGSAEQNAARNLVTARMLRDGPS